VTAIGTDDLFAGFKAGYIKIMLATRAGTRDLLNYWFLHGKKNTKVIFKLQL